MRFAQGSRFQVKKTLGAGLGQAWYGWGHKKDRRILSCGLWKGKSVCGGDYSASASESAPSATTVTLSVASISLCNLTDTSKVPVPLMGLSSWMA